MRRVQSGGRRTRSPGAVRVVVGAAVVATLLGGCGGDGGKGAGPTEGGGASSSPTGTPTEESAPYLYESTASGSVEEFEQRSWCENGSDQVYLVRTFAGEAPALQGSLEPEDYEAGVARLVPLSRVVAAQAPTPELQEAASQIADNWAALDDLIQEQGGAENLSPGDAPELQDDLEAALPATAQLREALDEECLGEVPEYGERLLPPL